jgi:hypothetical protein
MQHTRLEAVTRFGRIQHAVLFATDLAARGLDFPSIDWVVQADAPEDAATYLGVWKRVSTVEGYIVITKLAKIRLDMIESDHVYHAHHAYHNTTCLIRSDINWDSLDEVDLKKIFSCPFLGVTVQNDECPSFWVKLVDTDQHARH